MSDGDPRTGTFHQTWVTAGDTACSVNGVSESHNVYVLKIDQMSHENSKYKSFKVTVSISRLHDLLKEEAWPPGIGARRFCNIRKQYEKYK